MQQLRLGSLTIVVTVGLLLIIMNNTSADLTTDTVHENNNENLTRLNACPELKVKSGTVNSTVISVSSNWTQSGEKLTFRLKSDFEDCKKASYFFSLETANATSEDLHATDKEYIDTNGILRLQTDFYHPYEYCVYETSNYQITLKICNATCDGLTPCIAKCCSVGKSIDYVNGDGCVEDSTLTGKGWKPKFFEDPHHEVSSFDLSQIKPHVKQFPPKCTFPNGTVDVNYETLPSVDVPDFELTKMAMRLRKDGSLLYLGLHRSWEVLPWDSFCIDYILLDEQLQGVSKENGSNVFPVHGDRHFVILKCVQFFEKTGRLSLFYVTAMFISAFFLVLTGFVYAVLWDKHNIHGWTILCHVISMFFLYVLLGISHTFGLVYEYDDFLESISCQLIGVAIHFFFISTFCWLTLINLDLWSTFRSLTPVGERSRGVRRFILYNVFAWGLAGIVVIVGVSMDYVYPEVYGEVIVPQYGQTNCFIAPWAMGYYVYSIIGVLMIINFVFISLTSWTIYKFRETTRMIQHSKSGGSLQSFKLFSKLFVIMGVTWVLEIVSWLITGEKTTLYWALLDCVNIFQAIAIFVIFICKRKTLIQLQQKFPSCSQTWPCCDQATSTTPKTSSDKDQSTGTTTANSKQTSQSKSSH